jgi:hypothetical protein
LQTQGLSQRQAAKQLEVPRTTLQAWCAWQGRLDACPQVLEFFESVPGLTCLHRLVLAFHVVCVEIGSVPVELVASFVNRSNLVKSWEKTETCEGRASGTYGQKNAAITRIPAPYAATESHHFSHYTALV